MSLSKLHDPANGLMRVVGLMSGSGSNLRKIIELERTIRKEKGLCPFHVPVIFSDNAKSNAVVIGRDYDLPVITRDIAAFYKARGIPRSDLGERVSYDLNTVGMLSPFGVSVAAYAGYMSIATAPLIHELLGVNVHPADLSITNADGSRKYTGDHTVRDAILAGEPELRSTTHIIEKDVDYGRILMISRPLAVELGDSFDPSDKDLVKRVSDEHQDRLKEIGDWDIFPKTLLCLAEGRYAQDEKGVLYFDEKPIQSGLRLD
ncbi:formyl transferase [Candidatus Woesearchaeota archaeon]|nr:formyl transferase [Candidatus Woesearchaeota archaeon]